MEKKEKLHAYLKTIDEVIENGKYKDDWKSLINHELPTWYRNAKFGIFIHWGVFSVPAYGDEWYCKHMHEKETVKHGHNFFEHHINTYGEHKNFGYKDFVPMFKCENFNAKEWVDLFQEAGAKFVMPVAEHHDGFAMYDCCVSDWNAVKMGPKKDMLGLMKEEVEKHGMTFTASSHRAEHHMFMGAGRTFDSDMGESSEYGHIYWPSNPPGSYEIVDGHPVIDELFLQDFLVRTCEIVDKYHPKIMYFDCGIRARSFHKYMRKFMAYYYNRALEWGEEVTINYKHDFLPHSTGVVDIERGQFAETAPFFWQNDTAVAKLSWCYTEDNDFKEPFEIICDLVDVVSKNGSLLLNIGPKADGTIPEEDAHILKEIGKWMKVNGEAIYDSYNWRKFGEGPTKTKEGHMTDVLRDSFTTEDFRFTTKDNILYAFAMKWPEDGVVRIKILGRNSRLFNGIIKNISILGASECSYKECDEYLTVKCDGINTKAPVCIKIECE